MPARSPEALARKQARANERKKERRRTERGFSQGETRARAQRNRTDNGRSYQRQRDKQRAAIDGRTFVGCDGEGIGRQPHHRYVLFRMGERELYNGGERLTSAELLKFIVDHPDPTEILTGFAFDYDVSNILRDLPADRLKRLLGLVLSSDRGTKDPYTRNGGWTWVHFGLHTYGLQYIPRNFLKVCVGVPVRVGARRYELQSMAGSTRTIYDSWGNFQGTFLSALQRWDIGDQATWEVIAKNKGERDSFETITPEIRDYCRRECFLLADMMTAFRSACLAGGIRPRTWNGAGKLAKALMRDHDVIKKDELETMMPAGLLRMAHAAYYGGRFEITRCGAIDRPVHACDLRSAYPAAMQSLPCLLHGKWRKAAGRELVTSSGLYVAPVTYKHPRKQFLCGFPFRSHKDGRLSWPREGRGVYWSPEIHSAQALGADVTIGDGWLYEKRCDCRPFEWVEDLYEYRRSLGNSAKGIPFKLGYNSIYGSWAQRVGKPPYANPIYAGLCTALTRAELNKAIVAIGPSNVVMMATDGIFSIGRKPRLKFGESLGQWEYKRHPSIFIVRPGLYWSPKPRSKAFILKSRGLSPKYFEPMVPRFRSAWAGFIRRRDNAAARGVELFPLPPVLAVKVTTFVGARLALHINRPDQFCQWITRDVHIRFESDGGGKRSLAGWEGRAQLLGSLAGDPLLASATYEAGKLLSTAGEWELDRLYMEAQPDVIDQSIPFDHDA